MLRGSSWHSQVPPREKLVDLGLSTRPRRGLKKVDNYRVELYIAEINITEAP